MLSLHHKEAKITVHPRFVVKYLGCCDATETEDTEADFHAKLTQILEVSSIKMHDLKKMVLTVTERGLSLKCPKLGKEYFFAVNRICSCGRDDSMDAAFMFTFKPKNWQTHLECHAVICSSKETSLELREAISWMFKAAALTQRQLRLVRMPSTEQELVVKAKTPPMLRKKRELLTRSLSVL
jgi:hypothetical protein